MLKRFFWSFLAFAFPWLMLLIYDNPGGAIVALFMQVTVIGWPAATMWAWRVRKEAIGQEEEKVKKKTPGEKNAKK